MKVQLRSRAAAGGPAGTARGSTLLRVLAAALISAGLAAAAAASGVPRCDPGYSFDRVAGGCVQSDCLQIQHAHYTPGGQCVCGSSGSIAENPADPNKECLRPYEYAACRGCVYACVHLDEDCPGESRRRGGDGAAQGDAASAGSELSALDLAGGDALSVFGEVRVLGPEGGDWQPLETDREIRQGDRIKTGPGSRVSALLPGRTLVVAGPETTLSFERIESAAGQTGERGFPSSPDTAPTLDLLAVDGEVRLIMGVSMDAAGEFSARSAAAVDGSAGSGEGSVRARTLLGTVAVPRGTDFVLSTDPDRSLDRCLVHRGEVEITTPSGSQLLRSGQQLGVRAGRLEAVQPLSEESWAALEQQLPAPSGRPVVAGKQEPLPGGGTSRQTVTVPEFDVDRPQGSAYNSFFTNEDWRGCAERCGREEQCWSWTWVKPGVQGAVAKCWLKSIVPPAEPNPCCISGVKSAAGLRPPGCEALAGDWRWSGGASVDCSGDGTCSSSHGLRGRWTCLAESGRFELRWSRGAQIDAFIDTVLISPDGRYLAGTNQYGVAVSAVRE